MAAAPASVTRRPFTPIPLSFSSYDAFFPDVQTWIARMNRIALVVVSSTNGGRR